jgi:hypothetical protein
VAEKLAIEDCAVRCCGCVAKDAEIAALRAWQDAVAAALLGKSGDGWTYVPATIPSEIASLRAEVERLQSHCDRWRVVAGRIWERKRRAAGLARAYARVTQAAVAEVERLNGTVRELGEQLEFDRTKVADAITAARKALDSRFWLTEGRGSYEWDDDRYRDEFGAAWREMKASVESLAGVAADWSGCPRKAEDVAAARVDLKAEVERLTRERDDGLHVIRELRAINVTPGISLGYVERLWAALEAMVAWEDDKPLSYVAWDGLRNAARAALDAARQERP